ncbi:hypothetical protein Hdeb2414_s0026g00680391 [Helianthus debilis subsp. tardiflorus]
MDWVPTYAKTYTDNQENWVEPVAEQNYRNIQQATNEWSGDGPPIAPYQEALGERRGWYRGMGHKPSSNTFSNMSSSQARTQEPFSEDFVKSLFQTPSFLNQLNNYLASQGKGKSNDYNSDDLFDNDSDERLVFILMYDLIKHCRIIMYDLNVVFNYITFSICSWRMFALFEIGRFCFIGRKTGCCIYSCSIKKKKI